MEKNKNIGRKETTVGRVRSQREAVTEKNLVVRNGMPNVLRDEGSNPGLIAQRYILREHGEDDSVKVKALERTIVALKNVKDLYKHSFDLWKDSFKSTSEERKIGFDVNFTDGRRVIVGLGSDSVIETGVTLSHTYGVPYLPGSSIKGMTAHYCNECYKDTEKELAENGAVYNLLFGSQKEAGLVFFHDAWIDPESVWDSEAKSGTLKLDVMTPHHTDYNVNGSAPPSDFDSPTPIPFLSVVGKFHIYLTIEENVDQNDAEKANVVLELAEKLVKGALKYKGIGGKKSSGYGFGYDPDPKDDTAPKLIVNDQDKKVDDKKKQEPKTVTPNPGDKRKLRRIKAKGELRFIDVATNTVCVIYSKDKPQVKETYKVNSEGMFEYVLPLGDKWLFKLPSENV